MHDAGLVADVLEKGTQVNTNTALRAGFRPSALDQRELTVEAFVHVARVKRREQLKRRIVIWCR